MNRIFWIIFISRFIYAINLQPYLWTIFFSYLLKRSIDKLLDLQFLADFSSQNNLTIRHTKNNITLLTKHNTKVYIFFRKSVFEMRSYQQLFNLNPTKIIANGVCCSSSGFGGKLFMEVCIFYEDVPTR